MSGIGRPTGPAAVVAGVGLALMAALGAYGNFGVLEALVTPGDPVRTANEITADETLFRLGIASLLLVALLDVVVAVALQPVFALASRRISTVAMWFRIAYAGVFLVAISRLVVALSRLEEPERLAGTLQSFDLIWQAGLILFAVHLMLIGSLAYRSRLPRILGVLLVVAGLGYLVDGLGTLLVPGYAAVVAQFTFVGEVALIGWLLIKGRRLPAPAPRHRPAAGIPAPAPR
jgi:Domain of unknown function (DUF4386)